MIFSIPVKDQINFINDGDLKQPIVTAVDPVRGAQIPKITIVEFGDYACAACKTMDNNLSRALVEFSGDLAVVWKDLPNETKHPQSKKAAIAARCAGKQNRFWDYHDAIMKGAGIDDESLAAIAQSLTLKTGEFNRCLQSSEPDLIVTRSYDEGIALRIAATPTIFIGEERITGGLSYDELVDFIRSELAKVNSSK